MAFSSDERLFALAQWESMEVWEIEAERPVLTVQGSHCTPLFVPHTNWLAYTDETGLRLRATNESAPPIILAEWEKERRGYNLAYWTLAASPDGRLILAGGAVDERARCDLWDIADRKIIWSWTGGLRSGVHKVSFSADGQYYAACGQRDEEGFGGYFHVWSNCGEYLLGRESYDSMVSGVALPNCNGRLVVAAIEGPVEVWDIPGSKIVGTLHSDRGPLMSSFFHLAMGNNTGRVALATDYVRDASDAFDWKAIGLELPLVEKSADIVAAEETFRRLRMEFGLASARRWDGCCEVWDVEKVELVTRLFLDDASCHHVAISADGRLIAACDRNLATIWSVE